jgi:hypothetical protein
LSSSLSAARRHEFRIRCGVRDHEQCCGQADRVLGIPETQRHVIAGKMSHHVTITSVSMMNSLDSNGNVVVRIRHTRQGWRSAKPAALHIHQKFVTTRP